MYIHILTYMFTYVYISNYNANPAGNKPAALAVYDIHTYEYIYVHM